VAAALHAAGAAVLAVDLVLAGRSQMAFCAVRPPGHHAEADAAMGFCFFNNVAVAGAHALARGLERIAVVDFDVHYGNGTARMFGYDPRVRVCQTYQDHLYPGWFGDPDMGSLVDAPLHAGDGGDAFRRAVSSHWLPALEQFRPELLLVSAGFDAHVLDPLAQLCLGFDDYEWVGGVLAGFAARHCGGRVVATREGGYHLEALGRSVEAFLRPFLPGAVAALGSPA
jgi:acetoin utilization deacetylase AcuC-like enzyme